MNRIKFETKVLHAKIKKQGVSNMNLSFEADNTVSDSGILHETDSNFELHSVSNQDLIQIFCQLENTENGVLFSSGELAIYQSILGLIKFGDHILVSKTCGYTINSILSKLSSRIGISYSYFDLAKPQKWESQIKANTKLILVETLSVPSLEIPDIHLLKRFCETHSLILIADNSLCTSYIQIPSDLGVDCVLYSNLNSIEGQFNLPGGVILGSDQYIEKIRKNLIETESNSSPLYGTLIVRGLETLAVRMDKQSSNALRVAEYLEKKQGVESVKYPFLASNSSYELAKKQMRFGGGIISFSMEGGVVRGKRFIESLKRISFSPKFSVRTTVNHPASTSHLSLPENLRIQMGAKSNIISLAIGLEHIEDILEELDTAITDSKITFKLYKNGKSTY